MKQQTFSHLSKLSVFLLLGFGTALSVAKNSLETDQLLVLSNLYNAHHQHCDLRHVNTATDLGTLPASCYFTGILSTVRDIAINNLPTLSSRPVSFYIDARATRFLFVANESANSLRQIKKNPYVTWALQLGRKGNIDHALTLYGDVTIKDCKKKHCLSELSPKVIVIITANMKQHTAQYQKYKFKTNGWSLAGPTRFTDWD